VIALYLNLLKNVTGFVAAQRIVILPAAFGPVWYIFPDSKTATTVLIR